MEGAASMTDALASLQELQKARARMKRGGGVPAQVRSKLQTIDAAIIELKRLQGERDEAHYCARILEHAYVHDVRPSNNALTAIRSWGKD